MLRWGDFVNGSCPERISLNAVSSESRMGNSLNPFTGNTEAKEKKAQKSKAAGDASSSSPSMNGPFSMNLTAALNG